MDVVDNRKPVNLVLYAVFQIIIFLAIVPAFLPKSAKILACLLVGLITYQIVCTQTFGAPQANFAIGSVILCQYLAGIDFALLTSPEELKDFHDKDTTDVTRRSFKKRVIWTLKLYSNPRGIGWAHEPSFLPPRPSPSTSRWGFVISRIFAASCCIALLGPTYIINASNPGLTTKGLLISEAPLYWRVLAMACYGIGAVAALSLQHFILSAIVIGCGFSSPERWPLPFGSPLQLWSIRRFWRLFWHQMVRKFTLSCTSAFMGCVTPKAYVGSTLYNLMRLYIAFFITGFVHMGGDRMTLGKLSFKSFTFFMLQPFGITVEILVSYLWRRLSKTHTRAPNQEHNNRKTIKTDDDPQSKEYKMSRDGTRMDGDVDSIPPLWIRCIGYVWVALWFVWTAAYMADPLCTMNMQVYHDPRFDLRRIGWW